MKGQCQGSGRIQCGFKYRRLGYYLLKEHDNCEVLFVSCEMLEIKVKMKNEGKLSGYRMMKD